MLAASLMISRRTTGKARGCERLSPAFQRISFSRDIGNKKMKIDSCHRMGRRGFAVIAAAMLLTGCASDEAARLARASACRQVVDDPANVEFVSQEQLGTPEVAGSYVSKAPVYAQRFMAVTAHPAATESARNVLALGGSAIDAAIAAQMMLNLVEPQSSGIGGGAFLLYFDAASGKVTAYDGRETAPAAATANYLRWIGEDNCIAPQPGMRASGRSIGVPGLLHMLGQAHREQGRLPWQALFQPTIRMSLEGFRVSPRLAVSIHEMREQLRRDPYAAAYFLNGDGSAKAAGALMRNPGLAATLNIVAREGAAAFYRGSIAEDIVDSVADTRRGRTAGMMTLEDLRDYRSKKRRPLCTTYRGYRICGMPPPSSGGIAVAATLGILENFDLRRYAPLPGGADGGRPAVEAVHLITEAERLAYADRDRYVADADFVPLPGGGWHTLVDKGYLARRAALIDPLFSMGVAPAGWFGEMPFGVDRTPEQGTSHISIVDSYGNAAVMTTTIESAFGSYHMTRSGFLLNNQLSDFSVEPVDADGYAIANRIAPGKRPRSSMAPTLVFAPDGRTGAGQLVMAVGSPGGSAIIQYVVKALVGVLDWQLDAQQAASLVSFGAINGPITSIGGEHPLIDSRDDGLFDPLVTGLRARGHSVSLTPQASGLASIVRAKAGENFILVGGADPRRDVTALGDVAVPLLPLLPPPGEQSERSGFIEAVTIPYTRLPGTEFDIVFE